MVKQKKLAISEGEWKDLRVRYDTAKRLLLFKIKNDLLTYDQAITLLLNQVGESQ